MKVTAVVAALSLALMISAAFTMPRGVDFFLSLSEIYAIASAFCMVGAFFTAAVGLMMHQERQSSLILAATTSVFLFSGILLNAEGVSVTSTPTLQQARTPGAAVFFLHATVTVLAAVVFDVQLGERWASSPHVALSSYTATMLKIVCSNTVASNLGWWAAQAYGDQFPGAILLAWTAPVVSVCVAAYYYRRVLTNPSAPHLSPFELQMLKWNAVVRFVLQLGYTVMDTVCLAPPSTAQSFCASSSALFCVMIIERLLWCLYTCVLFSATNKRRQIESERTQSQLRFNTSVMHDLRNLLVSFTATLDAQHEEISRLLSAQAVTMQEEDGADGAAGARAARPPAAGARAARPPESSLELLGSMSFRSKLEALLQAHSADAMELLEDGTRLLNDNLASAAFAQNMLQVKLESSDLRALLAYAIRCHSRRAQVQLTMDVAADVPAWVRTDPNRLRSILVNVVGNAVKFSTLVRLDDGVTIVHRPLGATPARVAVRVSVAGSSSQYRSSPAAAEAQTADIAGARSNAIGMTHCSSFCRAFRLCTAAVRSAGDAESPSTAAITPAELAPAASSTPAPPIATPPRMVTLCIEVSDNGPGVSKSDAANLFKRFSQTSVGKRFGNSSGLGLSIVHDFTTMLGGTIDVRSDMSIPETVFRITFPVEAAEPPVHASMGGSVALSVKYDAGWEDGFNVNNNNNNNNAVSEHAPSLTRSAASTRFSGLGPHPSDGGPSCTSSGGAGLLDRDGVRSNGSSSSSDSSSSGSGSRSSGSSSTSKHSDCVNSHGSVTSTSAGAAAGSIDGSIDAASPCANATFNPSSLRFLVVDDSASVRKYVAAILRSIAHNSEISLAVDGQEAVKLVTTAGSAPFDVIVMDGNMPYLDGYQATRVIRAAGFNNYILGLTGDVGMEGRFHEAGANSVLNKPVNVAILRGLIARVCAARKTSRTATSSGSD